MSGIKILLAKPGLDGHDVGVKVIGHALVEAGFDIVYSGLRKTIKEIVDMAVEHKVDLIGLSILSGTHLVLCQQMQRELQNRGLSIKWMVGGNIPEADIEAIKSTGALSAFPTGTTIQEVIDFLNKLAEIPQNPVG